MEIIGEEIKNLVVVKKLLRILLAKWSQTIIIFKETKDLRTLTLDQLIGSLMSHDERLAPLSNVGSVKDKAFISKEGDISSSGQGEAQGIGGGIYSTRRGRGIGRRGGFQGIRGSQGRCRGDSPRGDNRYKQCYYCNMYGHYEMECRLKTSQEGGQSENYDEEDGSSTLFLYYAHSPQKLDEIWILDVVCSNHMIDKGDLFYAMDDSYKFKIIIEDDKAIQVEGMGSMEVSTKEDNKRINDMYYIPKLNHNLLSVG